MDVSAIVTRIDTQCPSIAQVFAALPGGGNITPVASQAGLYTLLASSVSNRMYPLQLPESPTHPSIVYQMVSSSPGTFEGYDVTHSDVYVLSVRGADYDALLTLVGTIKTALGTAAVDITDIAHEFDQSENLYKVHMELTYTYIRAAAQTLPAAYVYPLSRYGESSAFDNYTKQLVRADYAILLVTSSGNIVALQAELQAALLGWQQSASHHEMEYSSGASIEGVGGLSMWREVYRDAYYMTQS